jgi:hypothetical protein
MNDRQAENHRIVRVSKHFFKISNSDSNDYNPDLASTHNPGNSYISFNNPGITNITSSSDSTITRLNPISFTIDLYYNNVSESLRNNRFHVMTSTYVAGLGVLSQGGIREGTDGFVPSVKLNDGIYKTGEDLGAEVLRALNAAAISWFGGNQIAWTGTGYNAATKSMKFRVNTAAPGAPNTAELKAAVELLVYADLDENGFLYDASRILGLNNTRSLKLPYDASQATGGVISPSYVDLQTIQVLQLRSSIAKRFFQKQGNSTNPAQRPLSLTNILFEIPTEPASLGGTLTWFALDNRYEQEILSNFDEMSIQLTDKEGNVVNFTNSAEWNFNFSISRDVITPSNEDRIKSMMDYNQFKQF